MILLFNWCCFAMILVVGNVMCRNIYWISSWVTDIDWVLVNFGFRSVVCTYINEYEIIFVLLFILCALHLSYSLAKVVPFSFFFFHSCRTI